MEKITKSEQITYTRNITETFCDKCGERIRDGSYEVFDTSINFTDGEQYPGCDFYGEKISMDICRSCTEDFKKLLLDNGYNIPESEEM